jgi:hypothetical protein
MHSLDEDFIETGINAHLADIVNREQVNGIARKQSIAHFAGLLDAEVNNLLGAVPEESHGKRFSDQWLQASKEKGEKFISDLVDRISAAELPERVGKDKFIAPGLTEGRKVKLSAVAIGAAGYAQMIEGPKHMESRLHSAPDVTYYENGCVMDTACLAVNPELRAAKIDHAKKTGKKPPVFITDPEEIVLQQLICGHRVCTSCQPPSEALSFQHMCMLCAFTVQASVRDNAEKHLRWLKKPLTLADMNTAKVSGQADPDDEEDAEEQAKEGDSEQDEDGLGPLSDLEQGQVRKSEDSGESDSSDSEPDDDAPSEQSTGITLTSVVHGNASGGRARTLTQRNSAEDHAGHDESGVSGKRRKL